MSAINSFPPLPRDVDDSALSQRFHPWGEPRHPGSLSTDIQRCQHWHDMDAYHSTPENSPLHHDSRCELHN